jgi:hypothetical protein
MTSLPEQLALPRSAHSVRDFPSPTVPILLPLAAFAVFLGLLTAIGYGFVVIGLFLIGGIALWALTRPVAPLILTVAVFLVPTPAIQTSSVHGLPLATTLALATACAALLVWCHQRSQGASLSISRYAAASLILLVVAAMFQLATSRYAALKSVYQVAPFWLAGLLLGSLLASNRRLVDYVGVLAFPLSLLAIIEFAANRPNLWANVTGANGYDNVAISGTTLRATSTFGHPVVAGAALIVMAFVYFTQGGSRRTLVFSIIVAGAIATVSRSALVGLAAGLLAHFLSTHRQRLQTVGAIATVAVTVWLMISLIPALNTAFTDRVLGATTQTERIRLNSLRTLEQSVSHGEPILITGRGIGGSVRYLAQTGGNLGFSTYDNQYVTSVYDSGFLVVLLSFGLIALGVIRARRGWRAVAPLWASAATMFFFEGLYWPVTGLLFWLTVGLATAPTSSAASSEESAASQRDNTRSRASRAGRMSPAP